MARLLEWKTGHDAEQENKEENKEENVLQLGLWRFSFFVEQDDKEDRVDPIIRGLAVAARRGTAARVRNVTRP